MATFVHGKNTKFLSGSTELFVETLEYMEKNKTDEVTHTGAGGFEVHVGGVTGATIKASGGFDTAADYHATPPDIVAGDTITAVHCKPDGTLDYTFSVVVTSFGWKGGPKNGAVRFDMEGQSTGAITRPA